MVTIITWPADAHVAQRSFQLKSRNFRSGGYLSGDMRSSGPVSQRFEAKITLPTMDHVAQVNADPARANASWRIVSGILSGIRGTSGFIRMGDRARRGPYFNLVNAPVGASWDDLSTWDNGALWEGGYLPSYVHVDVLAARGDNSVVLAGLPVSTAAVLNPGDLFEVRRNGVPADHGMLHEVTRVASSNADGKSRVYFEPGLRVAVGAGDMVVLKDATTVFRLASDDEGVIDVNVALHGALGLSLVEVLPQQ